MKTQDFAFKNTMLAIATAKEKTVSTLEARCTTNDRGSEDRRPNTKLQGEPERPTLKQKNKGKKTKRHMPQMEVARRGTAAQEPAKKKKSI